MNIPESYSLESSTYDQLKELIGWHNDIPEAIEDLLGESFAETMEDSKVNLYEDLEVNEEDNFGIIDVELTDGELYAVLRDYDGEWEQDKKVIINRVAA